MSATAAMIKTVRRYVDESGDANGYSDDVLRDIIEGYPLVDERGEAPYEWDTSTSPPTQDANEDWLPTYDLHAAAAQVWEEKAGPKADLYTFSADGGQYVRSEMVKQFMAMARWHQSRRAPKTRTAVAWPQALARSRVVGNLAEED